MEAGELRENRVPYFPTESGNLMRETLECAHRKGWMVEIAAAVGLGKTTVARSYVTTPPPGLEDAWLATICQPYADTRGCLRAIYAAVYGYYPTRNATDVIFETICSELAGSYFFRNQPGLIIVDEYQALKEPALQTIRALHDKTGVAIALLGSFSLDAKLSGQKILARSAQISSRLAMRLNIEKPSEKDLAAALDAWGIRAASERELLSDIGRVRGALRSMALVVDLARDFAKVKKENPALQHFRTAARHLGIDQLLAKSPRESETVAVLDSSRIAKARTRRAARS